MANIHDVARLAGVSPTTAKRAIREPHLLAPATLERVRHAIAELRYEPDQLASALRSGHNPTVGLVIGSIVEPFFAELTRTIGRACRKRGYTLLIADNEYDTELELQLLRQLSGNRVAGVILRSGYGGSNLDYLHSMHGRGTAIVEIDHATPNSPFSHVLLDNEGAVRQGLEHLLELGHRQIAALGSHHPKILPDERSKAFETLVLEHRLSLPDTFRQVIPPTERAAYQLTHRLMALEQPPTALFALTGTMAIGAFRALRERGLRIPHDVSLLAFDDYPWTELVEPGIDVLAQPVEAMGLEAVRILFDAIADPERIEKLRFPATLLPRGSCARPRAVASA